MVDRFFAYLGFLGEYKTLWEILICRRPGMSMAGLYFALFKCYDRLGTICGTAYAIM